MNTKTRRRGAKKSAGARTAPRTPRLLDFLTQLAIDPAALSEFLRAPEALARKWGLDRDERAVLMGGDGARIYQALKTPRAAGSAGVAPKPAAAGANPFTENLVVVGTGIRTVGHLTLEAIAWIRRAEKVVYIVNDPVAKAIIGKFHGRNAESLEGFYAENRERRQSYEMMVEATMKYVRQGKVTCFAAYGHPGVFAYPTHEAVRRARAEGYRACMLPGISAEDCLFADLGIDPGSSGCQSYEATDFLIYSRSVDPTSHLILWQIGILGRLTFTSGNYNPRGMPYLLHRLSAMYPPSHPVIVYEAPIFPGLQPSMQQIPLAYLPHASLTAGSTLYVPPSRPTQTDYHAVQMLGLWQ